jgi:hypothetical protein
VTRHGARHSLRPQHRELNPLWLLVPAAVVVSAGVLTAALQFTGPLQQAPQIAVQASALPRPDPTTADTSHAFLTALVAHHVAVEPHEAMGLGGSVCYLRQHYNASPFTLQAQLRRQAPSLRAIDVATLVDDATQHLC